MAPDRYEIIAIHRGGLSPADAEVMKRLDHFMRDGSPEPANFTVRSADMDAPDQAAARALWEQCGSPEPPCLVLGYPAGLGKRPAVTAFPLTRENIDKLVDSPVRRKTAQKIMGGASAVWIFLESGDKDRDQNAYALIEKELKKLESTLELPGPLAGNEAGQPVSTAAGPDVRIDFPIVRLSRTDPAERTLIKMLVHSEPDLMEYYGEPMAFPVYGRGRALYALVGAGITRENIEKACRFLIGACSCEVKALNPGVDLLIASDWTKAITESWIPKDDIPPLTGISSLVETGTDTAFAALSPEPEDSSAAIGIADTTGTASTGSTTGSEIGRASCRERV